MFTNEPLLPSVTAEQILKEISTIAMQIQQSPSSQAIISDTLLRVREILQVSRLFILQIQSGQTPQVLAEVVDSGIPPLATLNFNLDNHAISQTNAQGQIVVEVFNDIDQSELPSATSSLLSQLQVRASLSVQIDGDRNSGIIIIAHQCLTARQWQPLEVELIKQVALQLGILIKQIKQSYLQNSIQENATVAINAYNPPLPSLNNFKTHANQQEQSWLLLEHIPLGVLLIDARGNCVYANQKWQQLARMDYEQALGEGWISAIYFQDRQRIKTEWQAKFQSHQEFCLKYRLQNTDNLPIRISMQVSFVSTASAAYTLNSDAVYAVSYITEFKQFEQPLQDSLEFNQQIVTSTQDGIVVCNRSLHCMVWNPGMEVLSGLSAEQVFGAHLLDIFPSWHENGTALILEEALAGITGTANDMSFGNKATDLHWVASKFSPLYNGCHEVIGVICTFTDITERKLIEQHLQESEARYRRIVETANEGIWILDVNGRTTFANPKILEMLDYKVDEILNRDFLECIDEEDRELASLKLLPNLQDIPEKVEKCDLKFRCRNGSLLWVNISTTPLYDATGTFIGFLAIVGDISDRKQFELHLQHTELHYRTLVETIPGVVYVSSFSENTSFDYVSPQVKELLNISSQEWQSSTTSNWLDFIHLDDRDRVFSEANHSLATGEQFITEYRMVTRTGETIWVRDQAKLVLATDGVTQVLQGVALDISDLKRIESELLESKHFIEQVANHSSQLLYIFDLRTRSNLYINYQSLELLGYPPEEIQQSSKYYFFWGVRHPDELYIFEENLHIWTNTSTNQTIVSEFRIHHRDNSWRWLRSHEVVFERDAAGKPIKILGTAQDITDSKRVEEALWESQNKYQTLFEILPIGLSITDATGKVIEVNPASEDILGVSVTEQTQRTFDSEDWQIIRPDGTPMPAYEYASVRALQENRFISNIQMGVVRGAGDIRWLEVSAAPIPLDQYGVAIVYIDITERKRAEEALRRSEASLRKAQEIGHIGSWELNLSTQEFTCTEEIYRIYGLDPNQVPPKFLQITALLHPDDLPIYKRMLQNSLLNKQAFGADLRIIPACGETKYIEIRGEPVLSEYGEVTHLICTTLDITARKYIEEELKQQKEKERLVAKIARDIRRSLDFKTILTTTVAEIRHVLQADRVIIFRFEPDWNGQVITESVGEDWTSTLGLKFSDTYFVENHGSFYYPGYVNTKADINNSDLNSCHVELLVKLQVKAKAVVPIFQSEQLWGLLIVHHCAASHQWQAWEIETIKQLSNQVGIAIQQSNLYKQVEQIAQREAKLNRIVRTIRSSLDLSSILTTAAVEIGSALQTEITTIAKYFPDQKIWQNLAEYKRDNIYPSVIGLVFTDEDNSLATKLHKLEVIHYEDVSQIDIDDEQNRHLSQTFPGSWLLLPLHYGTNVLGAIGLVRQLHFAWQDWEIDFARMIADQLAIAIQQATANQELQRLVNLDGLTQIANRRRFDEVLKAEWLRSQREKTSLSLIMFDIDYFKLYNDTYGHLTGDDCLKQIASVAQSILKRPADLSARYGGEEFVLILPNTNAAGATRVAEKLRQAIHELAIPHTSSNVSNYVTVSLGIATMIGHTELSPQTLIDMADQALYIAKQKGRDRAHHFSF